MSLLLKILILAPPLLVAVVLHEIAHGKMAERLGDPTARSLGRLSLNPIRHIDPFMTLLLPGLLIAAGSPIVFGGAKPVPVNPRYFANPRRGMVWVALAGPITNFVLAIICYILLMILEAGVGAFLPNMVASLLLAWCVYGVLVNLVLALFNLVPVPPLDGGRIAVGLLPLPLAAIIARLEPYGLFIVFALLYFGVIDSYLGPVLDFIGQHLQSL